MNTVKVSEVPIYEMSVLEKLGGDKHFLKDMVRKIFHYFHEWKEDGKDCADDVIDKGYIGSEETQYEKANWRRFSIRKQTTTMVNDKTNITIVAEVVIHAKVEER